MARFTISLAGLSHLSKADLDEQAMLQMPVMDRTVQTDSADSDCACPGYFKDDCLANAYQGCMWTDDGDSNSPWCQCDPNFEPVPPLYTNQAPEPEPVVCCSAMTADCLACSSGVTITEYCELNPNTQGCVHTAYVGCFDASHQSELSMGPRTTGYTVESCAAACNNYNYFALQGTNCACGNSFGVGEPININGITFQESTCGALSVYSVIRPVDRFPDGLPDFGLFDAGLALATAGGLNLNADLTQWSISWGGSNYNGRLSPFQGTTLPGLDAAYGLTGDNVVTQVAWAYPDPQGTSDIINAVGSVYPETQGHRFIRTGGYVYTNAAGVPVALKEIAPAPRPLPADMNPDLVLQFSSSPITVTAEQANNACESHFHPITLGAFYDGGARHYCWEFSDATQDICPHGCFMYDVQGGNRIVFPIVWPEPAACCTDCTDAERLSCEAGVTITNYCEAHPDTAGCVHFTFVGCYQDDEYRDMPMGPRAYGYTMGSCAVACKNYNFFALQNNGWCVCGNAHSTRPEYAQVSDSECGAPCEGESSGHCGAGWRNAIYNVIRPVDRFPDGLPDFGLFDAGLALATEGGLNLNADLTGWSISWGGSNYNGHLSPFQGTTLPGLDAAYGLTGDNVVTQVAWAYPDPQGTADIINAVGSAYPETQGHRFIRTGGYVYTNAAGVPVALKEIAVAPRPLPESMSPDVVLRYASSPTTLTAEQASNACQNDYAAITIGPFYDGGARHYCWEFSEFTREICPHGCFMYDIAGGSPIVFPIVW